MTHTPPLPPCSPPPFLALSGNLTPKSFHIEHHIAATLCPELLHECLNLVQETSSAAYRASSIGWNRARKSKEMKDKDMRFVLILHASAATGVEMRTGDEASARSPASHPEVDRYSQSNSIGPYDDGSRDMESAMKDGKKLAAFLSYMHTTDTTLPPPPSTNQQVLYIYELHVAPPFQSHRLGSYLLSTAEYLAREAGDSMTMLTVFVSNVRGREFYERSEYVVWDEEVVEEEVEEGGRKRRWLRSGVKDAERRAPSYVILAKDVRLAAESGEAAECSMTVTGT